MRSRNINILNIDQPLPTTILFSIYLTWKLAPHAGANRKCSQTAYQTLNTRSGVRWFPGPERAQFLPKYY